MKRIISVLAVTALMVAMMLASAMPAFAQQYYEEPYPGYCYVSPYVLVPC